MLDRSTLLSEFLKQFNEEKLVVLTGRSFIPDINNTLCEEGSSSIDST